MVRYLESLVSKSTLQLNESGFKKKTNSGIKECINIKRKLIPYGKKKLVR